MIQMWWSPAQMARLRAILAVPEGDRDPVAADLLAVLDATAILAAAAARWDGLEWHPDGQLSPTDPGRASSFYSPGRRLRRSARVSRG